MTPAALPLSSAAETEARTLARLSLLSARTVTFFAAVTIAPPPILAWVLFPETAAAKVPPAAGPLPASTSTEVETRSRSETFFPRTLTLPAVEVSVASSPTEALTSFPVRITSSVPPMVAALSVRLLPRTPATVTVRTSFSASALTVILPSAVILEFLPTLALTLLLSSKPAMFTPMPAALVAAREPPMTRVFTPLLAATAAFPPLSVMIAFSPISALVSFCAKSMENAPAIVPFVAMLGVATAPAMDSI